MLPEYVLKQAAESPMNYNGCGQSVMELSHRSETFFEIINETEKLLRELLKIPNNYDVLFLQGGASSQFAMIPLNLMTKNKQSSYVISGQWSKRAYLEARRFGNAEILASSEDKNFSYIPKLKSSMIPNKVDYVHICMNNTIYGTCYKILPKLNIPIVADVSSYIMSEPINVNNFGLLYAGAQKNLGIAGVTIVIIDKKLIGNASPNTPTMFNYEVHSKSRSLYNTPPCYSIYICKLMLDWIKKQFGNLNELKSFNEEKAHLIYDFLDQSKIFKGTAEKQDRSIMNIPFTTNNPDLNLEFIHSCSKNGIVNIKGHRSIGGMRASIYNAMPIEGVKKLVEQMKKFETMHH